MHHPTVRKIKEPVRICSTLCAAVLLLVLFGGCRSTEPSREREAATASRSLLEERLLQVIEREQALDEAAAAPDAEEGDIQQRFHAVSREYADIIARNPDNLDARLLYGKLLMRYGDNAGARDQFIMAARINPEIAVIHQQLSTFYAEEGDYTRALAYALNAIELEPMTAAYHYGLGQVLTAYREEFINEAVFNEKQVDDKILESFRTASRLEPSSVELQFRYGEAFYDVANPDWEKARRHWAVFANNFQLTRLQEDAVRLHQARCLMEMGREKEADALIEQVQSKQLLQK